MKRYRLVCVADLPDKMSTDNLDEAIANSDAHYEVYDTHKKQYVHVSEDEWKAAQNKPL